MRGALFSVGRHEVFMTSGRVRTLGSRYVMVDRAAVSVEKKAVSGRNDHQSS